MSKVPVYLMPGLAASATIFERIVLSETVFEVVLLVWEIPKESETLATYAKRMTRKIVHSNPVLIGVSFGGILVQEMSKWIPVRKVIIISSVKSNLEFPRKIKFAKATNVYKWIPTRWLANIEGLLKFSFGAKINKRLQLYEKFMDVRDQQYLDWAIEQVVLWERTVADNSVVHIHGDSDAVFPIQNIQNCIIIKGGSHIMILLKYKWFNENLPRLILD